MSTTSDQPVLARMLRPASAAGGGTEMSTSRAWRVSLPRVSENRIGLVASVSGLDTGVTDLDQVLGEWGRYALVLALSGPEGARGLALVDEAARAALIEVQTTGRVAQSRLEPRAATAVDAALVGHVIDAWVAGFEEAASVAVQGWHTGRYLADPRAAKLAVDEGEYRIQDVVINFGDGARIGNLRLVTPFGAAAAPGKAPDETDRSVLMDIEADLHAVLYRTKVPLDWLRDLTPGCLVEVPAEALRAVRIEDVDGRLVTRARLGRTQGKRALKFDVDARAKVPAIAAAFGAGAGLGTAASDNPPIEMSFNPIEDMAGDAPDAAGISDLPDTGEFPDAGELPDLPPIEMDMPDLPDLPE